MPSSGRQARAASGDDAPKGAFIHCGAPSEEPSRDGHHSLHFQEEHCREHAMRHGFHAAKVGKDVGSGRDTNRPGHQGLPQGPRAPDAEHGDLRSPGVPEKRR
jgi:hypothetical protein